MKDKKNMMILTCLNPKNPLWIPKKKQMKSIFSNCNRSREIQKKSSQSQQKLMESTISLKNLRHESLKKTRNKSNKSL